MRFQWNKKTYRGIFMIVMRQWISLLREFSGELKVTLFIFWYVQVSLLEWYGEQLCSWLSFLILYVLLCLGVFYLVQPFVLTQLSLSQGNIWTVLGLHIIFVSLSIECRATVALIMSNSKIYRMFGTNIFS